MNTHIHIDESHPANSEILKYFKRYSSLRFRGKSKYDLDEYATNTHPDLVERFYQLGQLLPEHSLSTAYGYPVLVAPKSGVIFATATGTDVIAIRLPDALGETALASGAQTMIDF